MKLFRISVMACAAVVVFTCCSREEISVQIPMEGPDFVSFTATVGLSGTSSHYTKSHLTVDDEVWNVDLTGTTKAAPVSGLSGQVGVTAVKYTGNWADATKIATRMQNDIFNVDGNNLKPVSPRAWRNLEVNDKVRFYAYAPWGDSESTHSATVTAGQETEIPSLVYNVANNPAYQTDLLYARSASDYTSSQRDAVPLIFSHALTAVQFKIGFDCTVKSLSLMNIRNNGKFDCEDGWTELPTPTYDTYTITYGEGRAFVKDDLISSGDATLMLIPQTFAAVASGDAHTASGDACVSLTYRKQGDTEDKTITAPLGGTSGSSWQMGRKIVYTIYEEPEPEIQYIYFDLAAGNVSISSSSYSGKVYVNGTATTVSGTHSATNKYYVYQSNTTNTSSVGYFTGTGYATQADFDNKQNCRIPEYPAVMYDSNTTWADYVTNNSSVEDVISNWSSRAQNAGREATPGEGTAGRQITLANANTTYDLVLDNLWSSFDSTAANRNTGAIHVVASNVSKTYLRLKGDNRFSNIEYCNTVRNNQNGFLRVTSFNGDKRTEGSMTVAFMQNYDGKSTFHGDRMTAIGNSGASNCFGIHFDGGTVFVGMGKIYSQYWNTGMSQSCTTVIGGGGNYDSEIFISGGRLTAVSGSSSAAIGGSGGHKGSGGIGYVTIDDGEVYAYAHGGYHTNYNRIVPVTAIGGGCSSQADGKDGYVTINGGYVYAESVGGCAIGGGNAALPQGGNAEININGGTVVAVSRAGYIADKWIEAGSAIGGGNGGINEGANGGNATVRITGGNITAGSVGGGKTNNTAGKIGYADIEVSGGVFSGQFILAAGSDGTPKFKMKGGTIKNSSTSDQNFKKVQPNGGAVYMESGTCTIEGGTIADCYATKGGAIYMTTSGNESPTFTMKGGEIYGNTSTSDGGAVYVDGGTVSMTGGTVRNNLTIDGNGGAICVHGGSFTMNGDESTTKIIDNAAHLSNVSPYTGAGGNGGGIYVSSTTNNPTVQVLQGTVTGNAADKNGGGIGVNMPDAEHGATITIGTDSHPTGDYVSPYIAANSAALSGGGLCVEGSGSNVYIWSGTTKGNVSAYVKNEDIRNDGGTVNLEGIITYDSNGNPTGNTDVHCVTITFYANNESDPEPTAVQRVVTNTNSLLDPPAAAKAFTRRFYSLAGWNTKRDGTGDRYSVNGVKEGESSAAVMNRSEDLALYAVWEEN